MSRSLQVNGTAHVVDVADDVPLLSVLRGELGLCGAKFGCGEGECGACTVLVDGRPTTSCNVPLWAVDGKAIVTLEGLGDARKPHAIQAALLHEQAGQCGYCLPGIAVAAAALLQRQRKPGRAEIAAALEGHLCRCGSHNRIIRAVQRAAASLEAAGDV